MIDINGSVDTIDHWYEKILGFDLRATDNGVLLESRRMVLSREQRDGRYRGLGHLSAVHYTRKVIQEGRLVLRKDRLDFMGTGRQLSMDLGSIIALTIESNTVIVVSRDEGPLFFNFPEESGKKWEDCIRRVLETFHSPRRIIEFCPRIRFSKKSDPAAKRGDGSLSFSRPQKLHIKKDPDSLYTLVRFSLRCLIKAVLPITVEGLENIPASGPAVVVANHSSFLDGLLVTIFPRRTIWFMAKNSQYSGRFFFRFLKFARSFPVRRYTTDIHAVRNAIRVIHNNDLLGIFPEGERCWDNRMLPFKTGTLRLILALGKPVVPFGISGAYGVMPRWSHAIKRQPITIRIGPPFQITPVALAHQTIDDICNLTMLLKDQIDCLTRNR
jgi:1-acyl-sn-glycerol-3-phosphate acyltransferase